VSDRSAPEAAGNRTLHRGLFPSLNAKGKTMRSGLLWLIGVPIPIILLLAYCTGHF
jgi:hypothetical protein